MSLPVVLRLLPLELDLSAIFRISLLNLQALLFKLHAAHLDLLPLKLDLLDAADLVEHRRLRGLAIRRRVDLRLRRPDQADQHPNRNQSALHGSPAFDGG